MEFVVVFMPKGLHPTDIAVSYIPKFYFIP